MSSGSGSDDKSLISRLGDSVRSRVTGLNGAEGSEVRSGRIANFVPGSTGVLDGAKDVVVEADKISANQVGNEAERVSVTADEINVSNNLFDNAKDSFVSAERLNSTSKDSRFDHVSLGYGSEGTAASIREVDGVAPHQNTVAFAGNSVQDAATYTGDWEKLEEQLEQKALAGELRTDNFELGTAVKGNYSSLKDVQESLEILKNLDDRLGQESFDHHTELTGSSGYDAGRVRRELGKVLSGRFQVGTEKASETFGKGGNVFLERSDEIRSLEQTEEGLKLVLPEDEGLSGIQDFKVHADELVDHTGTFGHGTLRSAEEGELRVNRLESEKFLNDASEVSVYAGEVESGKMLKESEGVEMEASVVEAEKIGRDLQDSRFEAGEVQVERAFKNSENVSLFAGSVEASNSFGYGAEGLEAQAGEISGGASIMWGAEDSYLEADVVKGEDLVSSGTGNELELGRAVISGKVLSDDQNSLTADHLEAGKALAYAEDSEIVSDYLEVGELLHAGKSSKVATGEAFVTESLFNEYSDLSYLMADELRVPSAEAVGGDGDYRFNIVAAKNLLDLKGNSIEPERLVGPDVGVISEKASDSVITYTGDWEELEDVLDENILEANETDLDFVYDQMTDGEYASSGEIEEAYEIITEIGEIDVERDQREGLIEAAEGSIDVFRDVKQEDYSEEIFSRLNEIDAYTEGGWEQFYVDRSGEEILDDIEIIDTVSSFSFSDGRKQEIFEEKKDRISEIRAEDYSEKFFRNIADIEELTGESWEEFYSKNRDNGIEKEIEIIDRLSEAEDRGNETDNEDISEIREENEELLRELHGKGWGDYLMRNVDRFNENDEATLPGMIDKFRDGSPDSYRLNPGFQEDYFLVEGELFTDRESAEQRYVQKGIEHLERIQRGAGNFQTPLNQEDIEEIVEEVDAEGLVDTEQVVPEDAEEYGDAFIENVGSELGPRIGELMKEDREKGQKLVEVKNQLMDRVGEKRREKAFREVGLQDRDMSELSLDEIDNIFEGLYREHMADSDVRQKTEEMASTEGVEDVEVQLYDNNVEDLLIKDRSVPCTFPGSDYDSYEGNFIDYMLDPATQVLEVQDSRGEAYVVTNLVEFEGDDYLMVHSVESDDGITSREDTSEAIKQGIEEYVADKAWEPYRLDLEEPNGEIEGLIYSMDNHNSAAQDFQQKALEDEETYEEEEIEVRKKGRTDMRFDVNYDPEAEINGYVKEKQELPKTWKGLEPGVSEGLEQVLS